FEITDEAATVFSSEFYAAIADGYPIDAALAEARVAVFSDNNDVEWGTPVLYLRASDGRIFDVAGGAQQIPPTAATGQAEAAGEPGRVVPIVVPPWPGGGGGGGGSGAGASVAGPSGGGPSGAEVSGAEAPDPLPVEPKKPGRGLRWAILAAVAAVVALAIVLWPRVFPGGSVAMESPSPTGTLNASPTPTLPTTPSPSVSRTTLPPVRDVGTLTAVRVTQPLTIDGKTDDWQWQLVARADQRIAGSSRATGDIYLMWDDQALYLLASVTDATPLPPDAAQPSRVFRGDSVILELGPDKRRLSAADLARPTDAYYMFGLPVGGTPVIAILGPNAKGTSFETSRDPRALDAAITPTNNGYVLEARIPWATTRLNGVGAGAVFAANVQVAERKADGYANLGMMSTNPQRTADVRAHPAYWQALQLQT
ncbi:MAG TPA: sugar-binding protein, partial [Micropruina sp.]|nr:sugar-binding protein [Micropruina sp.]